ncbi:MAG: chalcone isomerase family protein [Thermodesulfobacteriota bacterium]
MILKWLLRAFLVTLFLVPSCGYAVEIGGVTFPETQVAGNETLVLNGVGLRKKFFIKVYAGGLYLTEKSSNAGQIIQANAPMAIRMHFIYDGVSAEKLIDAWNEGFSAATGGKNGPLQEEINKFNSFFTEEAKEGDIYHIIYTPKEGTRVYIKDRLMGVISGLDFKQAVFAIWLGEKPADEGLKEGMLGQ